MTGLYVKSQHSDIYLFVCLIIYFSDERAFIATTELIIKNTKKQ